MNLRALLGLSGGIHFYKGSILKLLPQSLLRKQLRVLLLKCRNLPNWNFRRGPKEILEKISMRITQELTPRFLQKTSTNGDHLLIWYLWIGLELATPLSEGAKPMVFGLKPPQKLHFIHAEFRTFV